MWRELPPAAYPQEWRVIGGAAVAAAGGDDPRAALVRQLSTTFAAPGVVLTDSGTSALLLALRLAAGPNGCVAMPAWGCFDLVTAAVGAGVRLAFYDVEPQTLAPDDASLRRAARGARAIVVVHPFGLPGAVAMVREIAAAEGAVVIEDAAMAGGGAFEGHPLGALGDLSVLSFGRGKGVGGGGGGALLFRGPWASREMEGHEWRTGTTSPSAEWRAVLGAVAHRVLGRPSLYGLPRRIPGLHLGETRYHPPTVPAEIPAAAAHLALVGLVQAPIAAVRRRLRASALARQLEGLPGLEVCRAGERGDWGALRLPFIDFKSGGTPQHLGVLPSYPTALSALAAAVPIRTDTHAMPGATLLAHALRTAPTHDAVTEQDRTATARWYGARPMAPVAPVTSLAPHLHV